MATTSTARTTWHGSLTEGSGTTALVTSGAGTFDMTWQKRAESGSGGTNPEELLAAALATCYSMALSNALSKAGTPPTSLDTSVDMTFQPGTGITGAKITVVGSVPGITEDTFKEAAEKTKSDCPVSQALSGIEKTLEVSFKA
ncbi:MAG TPA: OsmC family peroxiredoxin [Propionibacteriaceae bacterium]|nr:OsmC family peroxiredoxin [Propionibacteriaceae bacterium]